MTVHADHTAAIDLVARALDQAGEVLAGVEPGQAALPTPCASWNVRDLVEHLVDEVGQFAAVTAGGTRGPNRPLTGDDWTAAYREQADALLAAWRSPGAFDRVIVFPFGELPAAWTIDQQVAELVIHAWDLAKASGQPTELDRELGEHVLGWAPGVLTGEVRGSEADGMHIGPEVAVDAEAPLYDRLAALGGRDPR
ncbi:TIGR03086 family metal-binding protein [Phytomonospora endophytica]|uniref:Uncharacterized protein (TIGR03086 family) n=1 Tax=Phytomonospora endophytica TaxID=714109 RepID=A0A841F9L7_9ACTN|nr:TIGR03086 family metal-binding protein [Phytomonospora endophytica]MBB6033891.1 uncharacterized protein (TIGR03086 family) [Phytomonospora endophytica]